MATAKAAVMIDNTFVDNYDENNNYNNNIEDNDCRRHHEARYETLYLTHPIFLDFHDDVHSLRGLRNPQRALRCIVAIVGLLAFFWSWIVRSILIGRDSFILLVSSCSRFGHSAFGLA